MSEEIYFNLFKAKENEVGIVYDNNTFIPNEDFTFKEGIPYQLGLKKQTAESGTQYISVRATVNQWAIDNLDKFSHLRNQVEEPQEVKSSMPNDEIEF